MGSTKHQSYGVEQCGACGHAMMTPGDAIEVLQRLKLRRSDAELRQALNLAEEALRRWGATQ